MSKYKVIECEFASRESLLAALETMATETNRAFDVFEHVQQNGLPMYGYHGDLRRETAEFVVRRAHIESAANDLGFAWDETSGTYKVIISQYDSGGEHRPAMQILNRVKQEYAVAEVTRKARLKGYSIQKVREGGVMRLRLVQR